MDSKLKGKIQKFWDGVMAFFTNNPFLAWNTLAIVALFILPRLWWIFFVMSVVAWFTRRNETRKQLRKEKRKQLIAEAETYIAEIETKKRLTPIKASIFLNEGERAFLEEETALNETRAVRSSGGSGVGFRVMRGVYVGGYRGKSESHQEWRTLDRGELVLTSKKMVFLGSKENRSMPLNKILYVQLFSDGIEVALEHRAKNIVFPVKNPFIWGTVINVLRSVKDPLHLSGVDLDVKLQWKRDDESN